MILCADDFGFSKGVSDAILHLCSTGKLNAVSVMVETPLIESYAARLVHHQDQVQIGLHFNLTETFGQSVFNLKSLILFKAFQAEARNEIAHRLQSQLDQFTYLFGRMPDFIDGHQHVHVFPAVRGIVFQLIRQTYPDPKNRPWVRQVSAPLTHTDAKLKVIILKLLNLGFRYQSRKYGVIFNPQFDGIYSLKQTPAYEIMLNKWLKRATENTVIMCHPANNKSDKDSIADARIQEFVTLENLKNL